MVDDEDIIRGANKLFKSVGSAVKKAIGAVVKTGKHVVGARGTIAISLERDRFAPGDEIRGKVALDIPEPIEGKKLIVQLRAMQRTVDYHRTGGVRTVGASKVTLYQFEKELGGPRRYGSEETRYRIVGIDETDAERGWASWLSPIARALLHTRLGQRVRFKFPSGEDELESVGIEYE